MCYNIPVIKSMTGFGRGAARVGNMDITVSVTSVNSRFLDVKISAPEELLDAEPAIRKAVLGRFLRGNIRVRVRVVSQGPAPEIDREALGKYLRETAEAIPPEITPVIDLAGLVHMPGVEKKGESEEILSALAGAVDQALSQLDDSRRAEGQRTAQALEAGLDELATLVAEAERFKEQERELRKKRAMENLASYAVEDEDIRSRLMLEVGLLLVKLDVHEEIERMKAHIEAFRDALGQKGAVGKRMEFLCQELHREANTLSSKSVSPEIIDLSIRMREKIEQIKEQARNIE